MDESLFQEDDCIDDDFAFTLRGRKADTIHEKDSSVEHPPEEVSKEEEEHGGMRREGEIMMNELVENKISPSETDGEDEKVEREVELSSFQLQQDYLTRALQNITYSGKEDELSDMEEALMMPDPDFEAFIQMDPVPGKEEQFIFQPVEERQIADDYY